MHERVQLPQVASASGDTHVPAQHNPGWLPARTQASPSALQTGATALLDRPTLDARLPPTKDEGGVTFEEPTCSLVLPLAGPPDEPPDDEAEPAVESVVHPPHPWANRQTSTHKHGT